MKKILITGITGFVGKHLTAHLLTQDAGEIIGTYRSDAGLDSFNDVKDKVKLEKLDLNDADAIESLVLSVKPDEIYHLAAQASPAKSFSIPVKTLTNNIVAEFSLLDAL